MPAEVFKGHVAADGSPRTKKNMGLCGDLESSQKIAPPRHVARCPTVRRPSSPEVFFFDPMSSPASPGHSSCRSLLRSLVSDSRSLAPRSASVDPCAQHQPRSAHASLDSGVCPTASWASRSTSRTVLGSCSERKEAPSSSIGLGSAAFAAAPATSTARDRP